ncbi:hypothetical protein [Schaalia hyovaginalis]|uniref:hypothetical protein n=1 Tax=Schaalia hyovaginalis TaxID=29316 RepID=UPI002A765467|nr:hypothetical protein [Schaalia hyovaginalis]MDY2669184.1 hypothetical protein [Schaalia hyovaginalis]
MRAADADVNTIITCTVPSEGLIWVPTSFSLGLFLASAIVGPAVDPGSAPEE